ncbi:class I SAM-dependent methyltransferase [Actinomadura fibrosa]|uniref:Class I SAM-dependent methyltransferase n=1 Tax=Actinomadura fibrosa TaxID=111802 RepID=A0ABW2Y0X2_9ACTN|nr:class I SAM-dependent methyltransferase [Actinomadura fibrosa]
MPVNDEPGMAHGTVAGIFNSAVAAWAIGAAWELGALDELNGARKLDAEDFAERLGLDPASTAGMFRALASVGVVTRDGATVTASRNFDEVFRTRSFFHWLSRGSAELFRQMPSIMRMENRTGAFYRRDPAAIAFACEEIDRVTYEPAFRAVLDGIDVGSGRIADLGCGAGGRLRDMLARCPRARGIGVDIAPAALASARAALNEAGLGDRVDLVEDDVRALAFRPEFADVEVITCFMMGHDLWPRAECAATLRRLREVFPAARRLVLGDATSTRHVPDAALPVFTLGFELAHDLMGTFIPARADWESLFGEGGWRLLRTHRLDIVVGEVIFELA